MTEIIEKKLIEVIDRLNKLEDKLNRMSDQTVMNITQHYKHEVVNETNSIRRELTYLINWYKIMEEE